MPSLQKSLIVLPVCGTPYIAKETNKNDRLKTLQRICGGYIQQIDNNFWNVHPICAMANKEWTGVMKLINTLQANQYKLWVNDNGRATQRPNMGLYYKTKDYSSLHGKMCTKEDIENCPDEIVPLFGRCCIEVADRYIHNILDNEVEFVVKEVSMGEDLWEFSDEEEEKEEEEEEDPYADEKAYDKYKGK